MYRYTVNIDYSTCSSSLIYVRAKMVPQEALQQLNAAPDLMMDPQTGEEIQEANFQRKREKLAQGKSKLPREDDIRADKREHSPSIQIFTQRPGGLYSEDWGDDQQEEDDWQLPDNWQRIYQIVFLGGVPNLNPVGSRYTSGSSI